MKRRLHPSSMLSRSVRFFITFYLILFLIGLSVAIIISNLFTVERFSQQVEEYNDRILKLYIGQTDLSLRSLDHYITNILASNTDLAIINGDHDNASESDQVLAAIRFRGETASMLQQFYWLHSLYVSGPRQTRSCIVINGSLSINMQNELAQYMAGVTGREGWHAVSLDGRYYLLHPIRTGKIFLCPVVAINDLITQMELLDEEFSRQFLLVAREGNVVYGDRALLAEGVELDTMRQMPYVTGSNGEYTVVRERSSMSDLQAIVVYNHSALTSRMLEFRQIMLVIIIYIIGAGATMYLLMRRLILKPLQSLQKLSNEVLLGNLDSRLSTDASLEEFSATNRSINKMLDHIESLRMNVYEEQLRSQQLEIGKLQQQIKPHFLLNSFNLIYNMAQERDFEMIQAMCLNLSRYFRYRVNSGKHLVPLSEEIECVWNYLEIQKFRYAEEFDYRLEIEDAVVRAQVVPLMIQTFSENTILHALTSGKKLLLTIRAGIIGYGGSEALSIEITDTGKGYPQEVLRAFKQEGDAHTERFGVGIGNIKRRLQLVFSSQARLLLSNNPEDGGARTTIITPLVYADDSTMNGGSHAPVTGGR